MAVVRECTRCGAARQVKRASAFSNLCGRCLRDAENGDALQRLRDLAGELDRTPGKRDVAHAAETRGWPRYCDPENLRMRLRTSWRGVCEMAGLEPNRRGYRLTDTKKATEGPGRNRQMVTGGDYGAKRPGPNGGFA